MQGLTWFKSQKVQPHVSIGSTFLHRIPGDIIEIATVVGVDKDLMGIPHVTYNVHVEKANWGSYQERRTLALESFCNHFEEAIPA